MPDSCGGISIAFFRRGYPRANASLIFGEKEIGSLENGKRADYLIIDRDILACPVDDVKDAKVLETWVEGKRAFAR